MSDKIEEINISDLERTLDVDIVDNLDKVSIKAGGNEVLKVYKTELGVLNKAGKLQSNGQKVLGLYQVRLNEKDLYFILYRKKNAETMLAQWMDIIRKEQ